MLISFLIAIGLNFDTFSVAIVEGAQASKPSIKNSFKVGVIFGIGQALMALFGSLLGMGSRLLITNTDHWIAFILLSLIGGKMILDSKEQKCEQVRTTPLHFKPLLFLVVATSIDALVVGITLAFIEGTIFFHTALIGIITFLVAFIGHFTGEKLHKFCRSSVKILGGIILILIGIKILLQHLFFKG